MAIVRVSGFLDVFGQDDVRVHSWDMNMTEALRKRRQRERTPSGRCPDNVRTPPSGQRPDNVATSRARSEDGSGIRKRKTEEEPPFPLAVEGTPPADAGLSPGSDPIAPTIRAKRGERQAEIAAVFDHWRTVCQHPGAKLDAKRSTLIARRLRDGYSVADLCEAVDGCTRSRFHQGANDQGKVYDGLELILRNGDKVDAFRKLARGEGQTSGDRDWKTEVMNERVRDAFSTAASTQQMIPQVNGAVVGLLKEEENDGPF